MIASQIYLEVTKVLRIFLKKFCEYGPFLNPKQTKELTLLKWMRQVVNTFKKVDAWTNIVSSFKLKGC